jgi:hypothetical protein
MYRQVQPGMSVVPGASMWWRMSSLAIDIALRADDGECSRPCTSNNGESCGGQSIANAKLVVAYTKRPVAPAGTPLAAGSSEAGTSGAAIGPVCISSTPFLPACNSLHFLTF